MEKLTLKFRNNTLKRLEEIKQSHQGTYCRFIEKADGYIEIILTRPDTDNEEEMDCFEDRVIELQEEMGKICEQIN